MQLSPTPYQPRAATPPARPPTAGRTLAAPWPFYVQAPRPCGDIDVNARRVLETSARYFSAPLTHETSASPTRSQGERK